MCFPTTNESSLNKHKQPFISVSAVQSCLRNRLPCTLQTHVANQNQRSPSQAPSFPPPNSRVLEGSTKQTVCLDIIGCVWKCRVPLFTQWFCWSLSLLNGYFIGKINPVLLTPHVVMVAPMDSMDNGSPRVLDQGQLSGICKHPGIVSHLAREDQHVGLRGWHCQWVRTPAWKISPWKIGSNRCRGVCGLLWFVFFAFLFWINIHWYCMVHGVCINLKPKTHSNRQHGWKLARYCWWWECQAGGRGRLWRGL